MWTTASKRIGSSCEFQTAHAAKCTQFTHIMLPAFMRLESNLACTPSNEWKAPCCRNGAQKLLGVLITIGEAVAYVVSGMYGDVRELGAGNAVLIILQVCSACLVTVSIHKAAAHVSPDAPNLLSHELRSNHAVSLSLLLS